LYETWCETWSETSLRSLILKIIFTSSLNIGDYEWNEWAIRVGDFKAGDFEGWGL